MSANKSEFDELYRLEHAAHFTQARTEREVDALVTALELRPAERVLDLGCGWGRHLSELKRRGFTALVGVDVQGAFLEPLPGVVLLERSAADLGFDAEFDAAYCAFNALFATADDAPRVLQAVSQALKPGGRFLLDTTNRERLARADNPARSWRGGGELPWLLEETHFDLATGAQRILQRHILLGRPHGGAHADALPLHPRRTSQIAERRRPRTYGRLRRLAARPVHRPEPTDDPRGEKGGVTCRERFHPNGRRRTTITSG